MMGRIYGKYTLYGFSVWNKTEGVLDDDGLKDDNYDRVDAAV